MNCEHLQENLYDYLDDILSSAEKAAAEKHLLSCSICREAVQRELFHAETISNQLRQAVEPVALGENAQRQMARAVQRSIAKSPERSPFSFWSRLAIPLAAAALILISASWLAHRVISGRTSNRSTVNSVAASAQVVPIHFSYSVPEYTFQKEGALVIDALTYERRSVDGALIARK